MDFLIKDLRNIFNKNDIARVYGMGDGEDEYDPEIEQMFVSLLKGTSKRKLSQDLQKISKRMFNEEFSKKKVDTLAKDILDYMKTLK